MALVITKDGKIRFAQVGDTLSDGEVQLHYKQGLNGGLLFDPEGIKILEQRKETYGSDDEGR